MKQKIAVALSGGVDSGLAAYILKKEGWSVVGFTLKLSSGCNDQGVIQAKRICDFLNIEHKIIDVQNLFKQQVIDYFIQSYLNGLTPNPCAQCNCRIKFGFLLDNVKAMGINYLATGHYARLIKKGANTLVRQAKDKQKSQEYFFALVSKEAFDSVVFPLGDLTKQEVKKISIRQQISNSIQKESQDVCFVKNTGYSEFIESNINDAYRYTGDIVHVSGKKIGRHMGIYRYTYGQRTGLKISWPKPLYVVGINSDNNVIVVGEKNLLYTDNFMVDSANWFINPQEVKQVTVRLRYNSLFSNCRLKLNGSQAEVFLDQPAEAVTPGQVAAFYSGDILLGGGIIILKKY